jgi:hypothetical protein
MGILELSWDQSHIFRHFEGYCINLPKPKGKTLPSLKYFIKHQRLNFFGVTPSEGIAHD